MKRLLTGLAAAALLAISCQAATSATISMLATSTPIPTDTPVPSPTSIPSPTPTLAPTEPPTLVFTDTPIPDPTDSPTATPDPMRTALLGAMASPYWASLGMQDEMRANWESYAQGKAELNPTDQAAVQDFMAQWGTWSQRLTYICPKETTPGLRVKQFENGKLVLYAIDMKSIQKDGSAQLFLVPHPEPVKIKALVAAPLLDGLSQSISEDGEFVEYYNAKGDEVYEVDAMPVTTARDESLAADVKSYYSAAYTGAEQYPRFRFSIEGEKAGFFGIEKVLTGPQLEMLREALTLFDRPELQPLKPYVFDAAIDYTFNATPQQYAGKELGGVVVLNGYNLFQDKILLTGVLAHEAAHVIQQDKLNYCRAEIADGTIPPDLLNWTADQLVQGIKDNTIGTTQFELWVDAKLGANPNILNWLHGLITSKGANGWSYCQQ